MTISEAHKKEFMEKAKKMGAWKTFHKLKEMATKEYVDRQLNYHMFQIEKDSCPYMMTDTEELKYPYDCFVCGKELNDEKVLHQLGSGNKYCMSCAPKILKGGLKQINRILDEITPNSVKFIKDGE